MPSREPIAFGTSRTLPADVRRSCNLRECPTEWSNSASQNAFRKYRKFEGAENVDRIGIERIGCGCPPEFPVELLWAHVELAAARREGAGGTLLQDVYRQFTNWRSTTAQPKSLVQSVFRKYRKFEEPEKPDKMGIEGMSLGWPREFPVEPPRSYVQFADVRLSRCEISASPGKTMSPIVGR